MYLQAGCFSIVLECVSEQTATLLTQLLNVPTIGIGSGNGCSGQVLVFHDLTGFSVGRVPKLARQYTNLTKQAQSALKRYSAEVKAREFPAKGLSFLSDCIGFDLYWIVLNCIV